MMIEDASFSAVVNTCRPLQTLLDRQPYSDESSRLCTKNMARYGADGVTIFSPACVEVHVTTESELHFYRAGVNNNHFRHKVETTSPSYQAPVRGEPARSPVQRTDDEKTWCIPKTRAHEKVLQANHLALDVNRPGCWKGVGV
nr:O-glycosyl hydrolases family 17 protein [Tanacetum cinerariifolium]